MTAICSSAVAMVVKALGNGFFDACHDGGIEAAKEVPIHRQEVYDEIQRNNQEALTANRPPLSHFLTKATARPPSKPAPVSVAR